MELRDFDHAGIAADEAARFAQTQYDRRIAESLRSLALGFQLLQQQVDRLEARINRQ